MMKTISCALFLILSLSVRAQDVKVEYITPKIVRVQWAADGQLQGNGTGACIWEKQKAIYKSEELTVEIDNGTVMFIDGKTGKTLLTEQWRRAEPMVQERIVYDDSSAHMEETANGKVTVKDIIRRDTIGLSTRYISHFSCPDTKALYGLGAHMEDYMNLLGKTLWLTQHNLKITVPMLISPQGYGLLFDAGCAMKYSSSGKAFTMQMEAARQIDYYFIKGDRMEEVVEGYRYLTGKVQMLPLYAFGYIQSKERYVSSDDLLSTMREYRRRHVPIDMIVQDWNYWPEGWGYMKMNRKYYPDPKALADSIHAMNAKLMVSIWPNPQYCPEERDFRQRGYMLEYSVYDVFNADARQHYWKYANEEFFSNGFDAWWCDSSEPLDGDWNKLPPPVNGQPYGWDDHERRWHLNKDVLSDALGAERSNLYSLYHSRGLYENQRLTSNDKRVLNLTRSGFAGQQRYATVVWNGDTHASWKSFRQQIPAGLNYMATGNPYWTIDVGSFFVRNDGRRWFYAGEFQNGVKDDAYKEYYTRMFQWATFLPMLRSHGSDTPREIWRFGEPSTPYYDAILKMIELRYKLLPYIYSMAASQYFSGYSMARPLAFDYPEDAVVYDLKDEYLFGDILVCPITHPMSETTTRRVYLPKGNKWYDYWTNRQYDGGQWIDVPVTISHLPLYVKAGSIIPTSEVVEYSGAQADKPITLNVYPGADATCSLYQDAGDGYAFEQGDYTITKCYWDDSRQRMKKKTDKKNKRYKRELNINVIKPI
ncbi:MAG: TIM-barrel domain-containing protein [Prevotella sp.]